MIGEITEEQLQKVREPIPFTPTKRLKRDDDLYVTEQDIPHPIYGYAKAHKEYSVIDLRGYRKGYEPRLEISGIYTPNPEDIFRLQTGKLPPYQPTTTGDKLLAEMRRLGVYKAFRISEPEVEPEEVPAVPEVKQPWQMTVEEWEALSPNEQSAFAGKYPPFPYHSNFQLVRVTEAIRAGKAVPQEVIDSFGKNTAIEQALRERGIAPKPPAVSVVEYDRRYTLEELREMAKQAGLSASGSKKEIAAKLIGGGVT
ncbi:hypothetical protein ES705_21855 [subsurface metagenome]